LLFPVIAMKNRSYVSFVLDKKGRNVRLIKARKGAGYRSQASLGRFTGISRDRICELELGRAYPTPEEGAVLEIATGTPFRYLFPRGLRRIIEESSLGQMPSSGQAELRRLPYAYGNGIGKQMPPQEEQVLNAERRAAIEKSMRVLTEREAFVLIMRYGLFGAGEHGLTELSKRLGTTRQCVSDCEMRALAKLRTFDHTLKPLALTY
jgi:transcriptional regulator with XRE-family HTH domain